MSTDRETLAEIHLLGLTAEAYSTSADGDPPLSNRRQFDGALGAAVAAGLVREDEAAAWRRHFERFRENVGPPRSREGRQDRTLELLDRLAREAAAEEPEDSLDAYIRFEDALHALLVVSAITEDEHDWWLRRRTQLAGTGADDLDDESDERPRLLGLRAVYTGSPAPARNGFRAIAVECYDDGVAVRWAGSRPAVASDDSFEDELELSDDVGTEYLFQGGGSGSSVRSGLVVERGETEFAPAIPAEARRLRLTAGGERFDFDVSDLRDRPAL